MKKILVVDDDMTSRAIVKALLSDEYEIVTANSGLQALGLLRESADYAVILLDMVMPGASGLDVLKTLRRVCFKHACKLFPYYAREYELSARLYPGRYIGSEARKNVGRDICKRNIGADFAVANKVCALYRTFILHAVHFAVVGGAFGGDGVNICEICTLCAQKDGRYA